MCFCAFLISLLKKTILRKIKHNRSFLVENKAQKKHTICAFYLLQKLQKKPLAQRGERDKPLPTKSSAIFLGIIHTSEFGRQNRGARARGSVNLTEKRRD